MLNKDSRPEFEQHLAKCLFCQQEIQVYRDLDNKLRRQFEFINSPTRTLCPEAQRTGEFILGLMPPVESTKLSQHLAQCPWCAAEAEQMREWLRVPDALTEEQKNTHRPPNIPAGERIDWLRRVVATLLKVDISAPSYVKARVRGSTEGLPLTYQAENFTIVVTVQAAGPRSKGLNVLGLVQNEDGSLEELIGAEIRLISQGQTVATEILDELGNFIFEDVQPPQPFELEITLETKIVMVPDLKLN